MFYRLVVYILLITLSGCYFIGGASPPTPPNPADLPNAQFLVDSNCMSGCWQGLRPGKTTTSELETFFEHLPFGELNQGSLPNGDIWYARGSSGRSDEYFVEAHTRDGTLFQIWVAGPFNLTLGDIVDQLGNPDFTEISGGTFGPTTTLEIAVFLFYPDKGYIFRTTYWGDKPTICIEESNVIYDAFVVAPNNIDKIIADYQSWQYNSDVQVDIKATAVKATVQKLMVWSGFTCIDVPYP